MKHVVAGLHPKDQDARAEAFALGFMGADWHTKRHAYIHSRPTVDWKGTTLYTIRCNGTSGKGPHSVNVPASLLWQLLEPSRYFCAFHFGDVWLAHPPASPAGDGTPEESCSPQR